MNEHSNPLDYILSCVEQGLIPQLFSIQNAKDELKCLKKELEDIKNKFYPVAWVRVNDRGDLYDPRLQYNPYVDERIIIPLYANKEEFKQIISKMKEKI